MHCSRKKISSFMRKKIAILIFLVALVHCGSAIAGDKKAEAKAEAKEHFESGLNLMRTEDFDSAVGEFEMSVKQFPTKTALFNLANCYKALRRYGKALNAIRTLNEKFGDVLEGEFKLEVEEFERTVEGMVAKLDVKVDRDGATVSVDSEMVGLSPLNAPLLLALGKHEVTVQLEGYKYDVQKVKLLARDKQSLSFTGEISTGEQDSSIEDGEQSKKAGGRPSALFWTGAVGTVVAGTVSGVMFGLKKGALSDFDDAEAEWSELSAEEQASQAGDGPWKDMKNALDDNAKYKKVGAVTAIVAGVLATASVVILMKDLKAGGKEDDSEKEARVKVVPYPGGLVATF